jgi:type II secretory pathway pseudopilin PulG
MRLLPFISRRAESLVESVIAITVITLSTTAALVLIQTSIRGNRVIGEKVVALNLALEGIEAVKNIRDTNYLNFASDPENCWDVIDATSVSECSTTADHMEEGTTYYLKRNLRNEEKRLQWVLETTSAFGDITHYEIDDGSGTVITEFFAQSGIEDVDTTFTVIEEDAYARAITFTASSDPDNYIDVTSTVTWENKGNEYSVSLTRTLSNVY